MLGFLMWGLVLNVYAFIVTLIATRIVIPKSERKRDSKNIVAAAIAVMLVPYMMMAICLYVMIVLVFCKFDYEELKKFKERAKGL
ncbi:hypothetical protein [Campylobacter curvus]|uniref:hypothetical protein n=1 Tax=Campylobacter curvus TaxID=200 RepID=UPI0019D18F13|nr:hypothetical protein [Campylobacter curvus]MBN7287891.1 hypothetical protein [Campylobacter curvus]